MTDEATATELRLRDSLATRLRDVRCDREPFTPDHGKCVCRLTNEAANVIERAEAAFKSLIAAIEREGFEVLSDVQGGTYSVRPRER